MERSRQNVKLNSVVAILITRWLDVVILAAAIYWSWLSNSNDPESLFYWQRSGSVLTLSAVFVPIHSAWRISRIPSIPLSLSDVRYNIDLKDYSADRLGKTIVTDNPAEWDQACTVDREDRAANWFLHAALIQAFVGTIIWGYGDLATRN